MTDVQVRLERVLPSGVEAEPAVHVLSWFVHEECSRNFKLRVRVALRNPSDKAVFFDQGRVNRKQAWRLAIEATALVNAGGDVKPEESARYFLGYIERITEHSETDAEKTLELELGPLTIPLSFARATKSYKEKSVIDIFDDCVEKLKALTVGQVPISVEKHLARDDYPIWAARLQYRESDWEFLKRILEREGLYFFFEHRALETVLHLCDLYTEHATTLKASNPFIRSDQSISDVSSVSEIVPQYVCVSGYQYLSDGLNLYAAIDTGTLTDAAPSISREKTEIDEPHTVFLEGLVTPPGDAIDNGIVLSDLNHLVAVRAEEIVSNCQFLQGKSTIPGLFPGMIIDVEGFPDICPSGESLFVAEVKHVGNSTTADLPGVSYSNEFKAYRMTGSEKVQFRPSRSTPKPRIPGFVTGFINAYRYPSTSNPDTADRDTLGRFNVVFQFDAFDGTIDSSNVFRVRTIQPGAGNRGGTYHALYDGTEVVVGFYKGDPDQPIIVGSVFNTVDADPSVSPEYYA
jgi:type VI secretion system secreted protein VgrG